MDEKVLAYETQQWAKMTPEELKEEIVRYTELLTRLEDLMDSNKKKLQVLNDLRDHIRSEIWWPIVLVGNGNKDQGLAEDLENARHIVACVNACEGFHADNLSATQPNLWLMMTDLFNLADEYATHIDSEIGNAPDDLFDLDQESYDAEVSEMLERAESINGVMSKVAKLLGVGYRPIRNNVGGEVS